MNDELIYDWIFLVTGATAVKANQNGPRPSGSFLTWQTISSVPRDPVSTHPASIVGEANDVSMTYQTQFMDTVSVQSYGSAGRTPLDKLIAATEKWQARKLLRDQGARFIKAGTVRDLTAIVNTKYAPVFQVDLEFAAFRRVVETIEDWIFDTVELTGEVEDDQGATETITITAP